MPGWIHIQNRDGNFNDADYTGVDLNPGGLSVILANFTDAINERLVLLYGANGGGRPTYHTANGDIEVPTASDFIGMDFDEIFQTLDDIEEGVNYLIDNARIFLWVDPDDLDTVYVAFAEVAFDATGNGTRPSVNITDKALWNFYKDTLSRLYVVTRTVTVTNEDPAGFGATEYEDEGGTNEDAWDNMIASAPGNPNTTGVGLSGFSRDDFPDVYGWSAGDDQDWSYDLGLPAGGSILKDEFTVKPLGQDNRRAGETGTVEKNFAISWDDPAGPNEILLVEVPGQNETYSGVAPSLFGLVQSGGVVNYQTVFAGFPADAPWEMIASPPGGPGNNVTTSLNITGGGPAVASMWIDYTSELDFV